MFQRLLPKKKKAEEDENKTSLLDRAFTAKSTTPDHGKAPPTNSNTSKPVAVYRDPYAKLRRQALHSLFTIILPLLGLLAIILVTINVIATNITETPTSLETITMTNVPLPAGVRQSGGANVSYFKSQTETWLPGYTAKIMKTEGYIVNLTPVDLMKYYQGKLLANKQWQIRRQLGLPASFDTLYVHSLTNGETEGIYLQILVTSIKDLQKVTDPDAGGTRFNLAKLVAYHS
ncbi:MAG: hypothetical protein HXX20_10795 [Chloroflexi bacterium]|nr:hypothetical protein [Chloroflexota bacterium]